jgi:uncharacterized protein (DUF58 family)
VTRARPTARGLVVLAGALVAYLAGWLFGTRELAALALVLLLALPLALVVVAWAARAPRTLVRRLPARSLAGRPLTAELRVEPAPPLVVARLVERCGRLGDPTAELRRSGAALVGAWTVADAPRGRYPLAPELVLEDAFGLARARVPLPASGLVRVEPSLVELAAPRAPAHAMRDGVRHAFASASGDGLAGVRDHEVGESLRRVHWRTSARRGRLTVRELEEHPRAQLSVVLDAAGGAARGEAFELAVRAAGSLAVQAVRAGASVWFESTGHHATRLEVGSTSAIPTLVDALCSVEADGATPIAGALAGIPGGRLTVVSADLSAPLAERVRVLRAHRRAVAIVAVDEGSPGFDAALAELVRAGAEVSVVRHEDDLARLGAAGVAGAA